MLTKEDFTTREYEVLDLLVHGLSNREIAAKLFISVSTVKTHVESILFKFGFDNRLHAAVEAVYDGIIEYKRNPSF